MKYNPNDPTSFSQPDEAKVSKFHLDWTVDFEAKLIKGSIILVVERVSEDAQYLTLDSRDLCIKSVQEKEGKSLQYELGPTHTKFGSAVIISLPDEKKPMYEIVVNYTTGPDCTALQWLLPEQTADRSAPYVFSQCQAIHCRSLAPIQDTPGVKCSYTASVRVPEGITALMSAVKLKENLHEGAKQCHFEQTVPIPSYLVAVVAGKITGVKLSPRVTIWCEESVADRAKYEFAETDKFVSACESYCGPYIWKVYDLVVLPPSFPFGGMENPCLTFVTPTLLAGDRSAVDVIVHEITHSWTGNLVTCKNWEHFWLNEGFTVFIERKIEGILHGSPARHFSAIEGWNSLYNAVHTSFSPTDPLTALVPKLEEVDPDDAFSSIPYEKGSTFLWYLEQLLASQDNSKFDQFIRAHIERFSHKCITSEDFKQHIYEFFSDQKEKLDSVDWKAWFDYPGMPPYTPEFDRSLAEVCEELHSKWIAADETTTMESFSISDLSEMSAKQIVVFLELFCKDPKSVSILKLEKMADVYGMWSRQNCEVRMRWLKLCLMAEWKEAIKPAYEFLSSQGRMKFTVPIYRALYSWEEYRQEVIDFFQLNKSGMMHVGAAAVANVLKVSL